MPFALRFLPTTVVALMALALVGALPVVDPVAVPGIDLSRMTVSTDAATAPLTAGGVADLTLEPDLQRAADRLLAGAKPVEGAILVIDVRTGRMLALSETLHGRAAPGMVATRARAPAASVFKLVTTTALLNKYVSPARTVCIEGGEHGIESRHLHPARGATANCGPFQEALGFSRNAVFAQLAVRFLRREDLLETAAAFGFNQQARFDTAAEAGTLTVPEDQLGFARAAAGFQGSTLSPLGAAQLAYTVALRGLAAKIHIVARAGDYEAPRRRELLGRTMKESVAIELRRMMEFTVHSGTALEAFTRDDGQSYLGSVRIAGKTGTLEPGVSGVTTTWFTGFAPSRAPRVVVTALVRNGPLWRRKASEVARDMFRTYFANRGYRGITAP